MVERILIISCEHQPYRRAAQVAMLERFGYHTHKARDWDRVDIIWGMHRDYHSEDAIIESYEQMGVMHVRGYKDTFPPEHPVRQHCESVCEAIARALVRVLETGENTIILEDDHYLVMRREALSERLSALDAVVGNVGVVQLHSQLNDTVKNDLPETPIVGAEDFIRGSVRSSHAATFVTPSGAEELLAYIRNPETPNSIENGLPRALHAEPWLYSVYYPKVDAYVFKSTYIQGESIAVIKTQRGLSNRRTPEQVAEQLHTIDYFRLK